MKTKLETNINNITPPNKIYADGAKSVEAERQYFNNRFQRHLKNYFKYLAGVDKAVEV